MLERDPRGVEDAIDLFIDPTSGSIVREPELASGDGAERRELYGKEPGRLGRRLGM